jgi:endonuclease-3
MKRQEIADKVSHILDKIYPAPKVPLQHSDSYTLLIAVLLSAHCTDARVNRVTPALFAKAATPSAMTQLSIEEIQQIIHSCGLSKRKAFAIWHLSHILTTQYEEKVPENFKDLEALPGVGHKTASVVLAQAFQQSTFPVDTHIHRCAMRWKLSSGHNVRQTEKDLKIVFPQKKWALIHLQMIYFGREYCQARKHEPSLCPICCWIP